MRSVILASVLLTCALIAFAQHSKTGPVGGKTNTNSSKSKPKPKTKPASFLDKPWDSPCGGHFKNLDDLISEIRDEWRLAGERV
jgi:hypothetical protein